MCRAPAELGLKLIKEVQDPIEFDPLLFSVHTRRIGGTRGCRGFILRKKNADCATVNKKAETT